MKTRLIPSWIACICLLLPIASGATYPLHDAVKAGKPSRVQAELRSERVNQRNGADMTPLMVAAMYDRASSAKALINAGARLEEATTSYRTTALMMAAMNGYHEVVEVLIENGASVDARNKSGFTALMLAALKGHARVVAQLLQAGADPTVQDLSNRTALTHASTDEVRMILQGEGVIQVWQPNGPTHEVEIPPIGKTVKFPLEFWEQVKNVNARLKKVLEPKDYGYLLACQLFWWKEREKLQRVGNVAYDGLECIEQEMQSIQKLVQKLEKIATKPEIIKQNRLPYWVENDKQGIREREYITDLNEESVAANEKLIVGLSFNEVLRYSFWDSHTGRLYKRLVSEMSVVSSPEYNSSGFYSMANIDSEACNNLPFLGYADFLFKHSEAMVNPFTGMIVSPFYMDLGLLQSKDVMLLHKDEGEWISYGRCSEGDAKGWMRAGGSYLGIKTPHIWYGTSTGSAMVRYNAEPQYYVRGVGRGFVAMNSKHEAFTVNLSSLSYNKIKCSDNVSWVSPAWEQLIRYKYIQQARNPMLAGVSASEINRLKNQKPILIKRKDNVGESFSLSCEGVPLSSGDITVSFMSDWHECNTTSQCTWGHWLPVIRRKGKSFYVNNKFELVDSVNDIKMVFHESSPWLFAIPLHLENEGDSARLLVNNREKTQVYNINFVTRKVELLNEWPCASPGNQRAFYVPELRLLAQPVTAFRYELLRLAKDWSTKKVADLFMTRHGDYAVVLPNGRYAGSPGCEKILEYADGERVLGMQALAPWRNRPAEVIKALGGKKDDITTLRATTKRWLQRQGFDPQRMPEEPAVDSFPVAEVVYPELNSDSDTVEFEVTLRATRKAITSLIVRADGVEIPQACADHLLVPAGRTVTVKVRVPLASGQNWLEVTPVDSMGLAGDTHRFRTIYEGKYESELYVVTLGVSNYADESLNLQYAAKDAHDVAESFRKHGMGRVRTLTLTDAEVGDAGVLEKVQAFLTAATVHDRVVLYIAGHGMLDENLDYYYAPHSFDPNRVAETGISLDALLGCLQRVAPRKRLLLMDTCHSGQLGEAGEEQLALAGVQLPPGVRAIQQRGLKVKKATAGLTLSQTKRYIEDMFFMGNPYRGLNIIAASAGAEFAMESDEWKNGVFCAAVCRSLSGSADYDKSGHTTVEELHNSIAQIVKELTAGQQNISTVAMEDSAMYLCGILKKIKIKTKYDESELHSELEIRDSSDRTPLMRAVFNNNVSEVRTLIEAGAYVDAASTRYGTTVLMMAAMNGYNEVVLELLSSGALVNATNKSGYTALHLAAKNGHAEVVRLLLQGGADKTMRDSSGKTAVDYAQTPLLMQLLK